MPWAWPALKCLDICRDQVLQEMLCLGAIDMHCCSVSQNEGWHWAALRVDGAVTSSAR
jgi:hypothetical protein